MLVADLIFVACALELCLALNDYFEFLPAVILGNLVRPVGDSAIVAQRRVQSHDFVVPSNDGCAAKATL